ncbi:hypothetical protein, partial [Heyndrickxia sporothermodurans]
MEKQIKLKNKRKKMSSSKIYTTTFGAFIFGFFIIFISPMITGGTYKYGEAKLNEYETLSNGLQIALVKKEYNPEKQLMRLDFSIKESQSITSLSDIKYELISRYIKGKKSPLKTEITQLNDNYFVAIIKGIPEGYAVLSTTIVPKYVHPELQQVNDLEDKSVKIYINETDKIINQNLKEGKESDYKNEYIDYEQQGLKEEIATTEKEIETNKLGIIEVEKKISELENEMKYQTEEEKISSQTQLNDYKTSI